MKIALIAHDGRKHDMVEFVLKRLNFFNRPDLDLVATSSTGRMIIRAGIEKVELVNSGPKGGDAEIGAMVANKKLDAVIFFRDPLDKHPHDVDINMLMRLCDVHNVPLATNPKGAHMVIYYINNQFESNEYQ